MACEQVFRDRLKESGLRLTPQRELVLGALHKLEGARTVEEIYGRVSAVSSAVDVSTVYRTLDLLREFGLVSCIDSGSDQHRYELLGTHGPHMHLVCKACGKIVGIEGDEAKVLLDELLSRYGFAIRLDEVTISGLCQECQDDIS
jgi:Fur family ferric uptake transcriptional regulator